MFTSLNRLSSLRLNYYKKIHSYKVQFSSGVLDDFEYTRLVDTTCFYIYGLETEKFHSFGVSSVESKCFDVRV